MFVWTLSWITKMTDRPAPGYTPARGEAKFPDLTLHKLDIPGFHWNYDKHKNTTRVLGPHVRTVEGIGYRLETLYSHEAGLGSRKVTASPTILSATGPFGPVTAAYSYGEEFPVYGFGLIFVKRSRLWKYVDSGGACVA